MLGTGIQSASASHTECPEADRFVESPNFGTRDEDIDWIVVHVTTGPYTNAINWFQNPDSNVSAHYVVSNYEQTEYPPGHVTQMVHEEKSAWHARSIANPRSIGIELEWWEDAKPEEPITEECYEALAELIRCVADRYDIPLEFYEDETCIQNEDGGIIGHQHVPDGSCSNYDHGGRTCPYPDFEPHTLMNTLEQTLRMGDDAVATTAVNGREGPNLRHDVVTVLEEGTRAEIINGPERANGHTWWGLFVPSEGEWVWVVEDYLALEDLYQPFRDGDDVVTTTDLEGHEYPGGESDVVTVLSEGTTAEIINGPETADGHTWWGLFVPSETVWVWCIEDGLELHEEEEDEDDDEDEEEEEDDEDDDDENCFITTATASHGSTLDSLRRFRDDSMASTPLGRLLIWVYYAISPPIASTLADNPGSRTARAVRSIVRRCATISDRQASTTSSLKRASLGTVLTLLYVVGILVAASGHLAISLREALTRPAG